MAVEKKSLRTPHLRTTLAIEFFKLSHWFDACLFGVLLFFRLFVKRLLGKQNLFLVQ